MIKVSLCIASLMAALSCTAQTVVLDSYFNNEHTKDGRSWHYKWSETAMSGFSMLGQAFLKYGADTTTLYEAPTAANLQKADVYIIVDPDNEKENPAPNFINPSHIDAISKWVKAGGVLVLMGNDSANTALQHLSMLGERFGITFTNKSRNMVKGQDFPTGAIHIPAGHEIFPSIKKAYLKEISILKVKRPAKAAITQDGGVIMAVARYGKGTVFAVGDPWMYNEYVDGKAIPADYENPAAVEDLVKWLLSKSRK